MLKNAPSRYKMIKDVRGHYKTLKDAISRPRLFQKIIQRIEPRIIPL